MIDDEAMETGAPLPAATSAPLSAATAWAQKRAQAIERAAQARATRAQNNLGGAGGRQLVDMAISEPGGLDFLDRLGAAEKRDAERVVQPVITPQQRAATTIKRRTPAKRRPPAAATTVEPAVETPLNPAQKRAAKNKARATAAAEQKRAVVAAAREAKQSEQRYLKARAAKCGLRIGPTADPTKLLPPLGYEVLNPIAAGAFSTILRCRSAQTGVVVAVKSFDPTKCARDTNVSEARDSELAVLRLLQTTDAHPHIANMVKELGSAPSTSAQVVEASEVGHQHAVLEYAEGGSLHRFLQAQKSDLTLPLVQAATRQLARALQHLHNLEVAHRDLKPANVLLASSTNVDAATLHLKLCDFGFACICGDRRLKTHCGTPAFLAPEIVTPLDAHKGYLGRPVDLWALGCTLYELLHRRPAFKSEEAFELEGLIRRCNHGPLDKRIPSPARALLAGLLVTSPSTRLTAANVLESPWLVEDQAVS